MTLVVICHMTLKNNSGDVSVIMQEKRAFMILVFTQNKCPQAYILTFPPFPYFKCMPPSTVSKTTTSTINVDSCECKNLARFARCEKLTEKRAAETEEEKKDRHRKGNKQDTARRKAKKTFATL